MVPCSSSDANAVTASCASAPKRQLGCGASRSCPHSLERSRRGALRRLPATPILSFPPPAAPIKTATTSAGGSAQLRPRRVRPGQRHTCFGTRLRPSSCAAAFIPWSSQESSATETTRRLAASTSTHPRRHGSTNSITRAPERGSDVDNDHWQQIVESLVDAKRCLRAAWEALDGTDGAASGVEHALGAALSGIDAIYAIEHVHAFNQYVASPADVQEFWEEHGTLPGFAAGT